MSYKTDPWPSERSAHAACCVGHAGHTGYLLITGGRDRNDKALNDMWLFNLSLKKWSEVYSYIDNNNYYYSSYNNYYCAS